MTHIQKWFSVPLFSEDQCDRILQICDSNIELNTASVLNNGVGIKQFFARNCKSGWLSPDDENEWIFNAIKKKIVEVNDRTLKFEVDNMEQLQYLEYGPLQFYNKHVDNGDDRVACRKLTAVVQLSNKSEYFGGALEVESMPRLRRAPRERGRVVIFPSHLPHKAHPVWIGKRKVLVAWIRGKKPLS